MTRSFIYILRENERRQFCDVYCLWSIHSIRYIWKGHNDKRYQENKCLYLEKPINVPIWCKRNISIENHNDNYSLLFEFKYLIFLENAFTKIQSLAHLFCFNKQCAGPFFYLIFTLDYISEAQKNPVKMGEIHIWWMYGQTIYKDNLLEYFPHT